MIGDKLNMEQVFEWPNERWPTPHDRLLTEGRDTYLAEDAPERTFRLLRGYKRAGDILIRQALSDRVDCNNLIFPALFNYRHYVELALKAAIEEYGPFADVKLGAKDHRLPDLWQLFLQITTKFNNDPADAAARAVGRCIGELAKIDANSTTFRYAKTLKGDVPTLPIGLDLVRLHDVMNGIENFFECASLDFSQKVEVAAEAGWDCGY
jgi:hypothetical protein